MALWGKTDTLASKPKYLTKLNTFNATTAVSTSAETITIPGHGFQTADAVLYTKTAGSIEIGGLTTDTTYYAIRVDSDTIKLATSASNATAGTTIDLAPGATGTADTLQLTAPTVFFVDSNEATTAANKAKGITGAGWWLYRTYTDAQSVTRHKAECLVFIAVSAAASGDAEDTVTVDRAITIGTHPQNASAAVGGDVTFSVVATATGVGALSYQWQKQESGSGAWANVDGATQSVFTIEDVTSGDSTDKYRVVISTAGAANATSGEATLIVTQ